MRTMRSFITLAAVFTSSAAGARAPARFARAASRVAARPMMAARTALIAGNWKMNTVLPEALKLAAAVKDASVGAPGDVAICVPFPFLESVSKVLAGSKVGLGAQVRRARRTLARTARRERRARARAVCRIREPAAHVARIAVARDVFARTQDCSEADKGAFTGAVSTGMLQSVGCAYVLTGHSERRSIFGESDALINLKTKKVRGVRGPSEGGRTLRRTAPHSAPLPSPRARRKRGIPSCAQPPGRAGGRARCNVRRWGLRRWHWRHTAPHSTVARAVACGPARRRRDRRAAERAVARRENRSCFSRASPPCVLSSRSMEAGLLTRASLHSRALRALRVLTVAPPWLWHRPDCGTALTVAPPCPRRCSVLVSSAFSALASSRSSGRTGRRTRCGRRARSGTAAAG